MSKILVVDDDMELCELLDELLSQEQFDPCFMHRGDEVLEEIRSSNYDILVLDIMLPDMDGFEVLRRLRDSRVETPVLILSGLGESENKVKGLSSGADDYLTKPFDKAELMARIQAIVRRSAGHSQSIISTGKLDVNLDTQTIEVDKQPLHLTGKISENLFLSKKYLKSKHKKVYRISLEELTLPK